MRRVFRIPFTRGHIAREVDDELEFHIEMRTQRLIAAGWSVDAARAEALRQFGNVTNVRDDCVTMDQQRERAMTRANLFGELQQGYRLCIPHASAKRRIHGDHRRSPRTRHRCEHGDLHPDRCGRRPRIACLASRAARRDRRSSPRELVLAGISTNRPPVGPAVQRRACRISFVQRDARVSASRAPRCSRR